MGRPVAAPQQRESWRSFICSADHPGRHLASLGASVAPALSEQLDVATLEAFLSKLAGGERDVRLLALLVEIESGTYLELFRDRLPDLLDQMSSETERRDEIVGPALLGSPRWGSTLIARRSGLLRPGQFFSRTSHRSYDIPENRVLAWLVKHVDSQCRQAAFLSRNSLPKRTGELADMASELSAHEALVGIAVESDGAVDLDDLEQAERSHRDEYREAARLARSLSRIADPDDDGRWHAILMLLAVGWLEPVSDDDLFELYVLAMTIDVLAQEVGLGDPVEYGLVSGRRSHVAEFNYGNRRVRVDFDRSLAAILGKPGRYKRTVRRYDGVTGSERRPDVVVTVTSEPEEKSVLLIEAKRSESERYVADSIYKVFGYLHDFAFAWTDAPSPHAILAVPSGITEIGSGENDEVAIVSMDDRPTFARAVRASLALTDG